MLILSNTSTKEEGFFYLKLAIKERYSVKAEYIGKMNLYLEALDRDVKRENENPSVGIILCSSKDNDVVEYSLSKNMSKTLISEYKLKLIDKKILENKLREVKNILDTNKLLL